MKKLILNICTLFVTAALLIFVCLAWYTSNKNVSANGIIGSTLGENYSLELERGTYNGTEWEWNKTNSLSFTNMNPGNVFYFRIKISFTNSENKYSINVSFDKVDSELIDGNLIVENGYVCKKRTVTSTSATSQNIPLYKIENNVVKVSTLKKDGKYDNIKDYTTEKILYKINSNSITLADMKIQNAFNTYKIEEPNAEPEVENKKLELLEPNKLDNAKFVYDVTIDENKLSYIYFALEFNENASLAKINDAISSNAYLYQKLIIGAISVTTNKQDSKE